MLIRIFAKKLQRSDFIFPTWPAYCEGLRSVDVFCSLNRKTVSCAPAQQRERFIENKIAGDTVFAVRAKFLPGLQGAAMMLILHEAARQECSGVDEYHFS